uniref:Uncharacterized protein n=1 Tax=Glossina palpalis gambiensis TaxID=67801 RepID=A0A1B0ARM2_9MUSC
MFHGGFSNMRDIIVRAFTGKVYRFGFFNSCACQRCIHHNFRAASPAGIEELMMIRNKGKVKQQRFKYTVDDLSYPFRLTDPYESLARHTRCLQLIRLGAQTYRFNLTSRRPFATSSLLKT